LQGVGRIMVCAVKCLDCQSSDDGPAYSNQQVLRLCKALCRQAHLVVVGS
jgi:hypothetical protein